MAERSLVGRTPVVPFAEDKRLGYQRVAPKVPPSSQPGPGPTVRQLDPLQPQLRRSSPRGGCLLVLIPVFGFFLGISVPSFNPAFARIFLPSKPKDVLRPYGGHHGDSPSRTPGWKSVTSKAKASPKLTPAVVGGPPQTVDSLIPPEGRKGEDLKTGPSVPADSVPARAAMADEATSARLAGSKTPAAQANSSGQSGTAEQRRPDEAASTFPQSSEDLFRLWMEAYEIETKAKRKLKAVTPNGIALDEDQLNARVFSGGPRLPSCRVPQAPHLQCCDSLTALRADADKRGPKGELPAWTEPKPANSPGEDHYPRTPWVQGEPKDNLPLTHQVQADLWAHQFPPDQCSTPSTRYLVGYWDNSHHHGMGSHLHLMTVVLGLAVQHKRVFGLLNYTFARAGHEGCRGPHNSSFACYFSLPVSPECDRKINDIWREKDKDWRSERFYDRNRAAKTPGFLQLLAGDEQYLVVSPRILLHDWNSNLVPTRWGAPWKKCIPAIMYGEDRSLSPRVLNRLEIGWWRAQGIRFLMRWPSAYLCHLLNFARHQTYGREAAEVVYQRLATQDSGPAPSSLVRCSEPTRMCQVFGSGGSPSLNPDTWIPHPMIRVHVRGSDKRTEMSLISLINYVNAAQVMRATMLPRNSSIWLSSEEQEVISRSRSFYMWKFYTLVMEKKHVSGETEQQWVFANQFGLRDYVEASLLNLLIGQQSDGFLFALQSNWERLSNELRTTGGKLNSPFKALNQGEM